MQTSKIPVIFFCFCIAFTCPQIDCAMAHKAPSDLSEFLILPENTTVPEGETALLKCMVSSDAHVCRWYYLPMGEDFFDVRFSPILVKDFSPSENVDCSIRFKKVKKLQEGQWLCQVLKFHSNQFLMTSPVVLRVITESEIKPATANKLPTTNVTEATTSQPSRDGRIDIQNDERLSFTSEEESQFVNVINGNTAILQCKTNLPLSTCSWLRPNGVKIQMWPELQNVTISQSDINHLDGQPKDGDCSLKILEVTHENEGNWRCLVKPQGGEFEADVKGPFVHLHIQDLFRYLPEHSHRNDARPENNNSNTFITTIIVTTSITLCVIVTLLFVCLYHRVQVSNSETRKILQLSRKNSHNSSHPDKFICTTDLKSHLDLEINEKPFQLQQQSPMRSENQYLDVKSGLSNAEGYVIMPVESERSSMSSQKSSISTASTMPVGRNRSFSFSSLNTTDSNDGGNSANLTFDNPSYRPNSKELVTKEPLPRPDSFVYDTNHVYEEIQEYSGPPSSMTSHLREDTQGYMIPNEQEENSAPFSNHMPNQPHYLRFVDVVRPMLTTFPAPSYSKIGEANSLPMLEPELGYSRVGLAPAVAVHHRYDTPCHLTMNQWAYLDLDETFNQGLNNISLTNYSENGGIGLVGTVV